MKNTIKLYALLLILTGCAAGVKTVGEISLHPSGKGSAAYTRMDPAWVFEEKGVKISVSHARAGEGSALVEGLLEKEYLLLKMRIENSSGSIVVFNPALASLRDKTEDYKKPLDFTDFYAMTKDDPRMDLSGSGKLFYDLTETVQPGQESSKLLAFKPLSKDAGGLDLVIKNLYIGPYTVDLSFPLEIKP